MASPAVGTETKKRAKIGALPYLVPSSALLDAQVLAGHFLRQRDAHGSEDGGRDVLQGSIGAKSVVLRFLGDVDEGDLHGASLSARRAIGKRLLLTSVARQTRAVLITARRQ